MNFENPDKPNSRCIETTRIRQNQRRHDLVDKSSRNILMGNKGARMKTLMRCSCMLLILTSTTFQAPASVASAYSFDGEWVNVNNQTHGVTRLVINEEVANSKIEAWGRCHPNDCYWGKVDLKLVGRSVTDHSFEYALAVWEHSHATQYMILTRKEQTMTVETITIFKDGSSRSNYRTREEMRRASEVVSGDDTKAIAPIQISPADGSVFDHYPRKTDLIWAEVPNARSYTVEIDFYSPNSGWRNRLHPDSPWLARNITTTSYTFNFVGAQPGRWRVWAVDADGQEGPKSEWWTFRYTR